MIDEIRSSKKYGKILEDDQYSDPDTNNTKNRIATNFLTSLKCKLTDSVCFQDEAIIVHRWQRTLSPGSIWEFNLHHHLGKGIHLNQIYDFSMKNKDHRSGYFYVL
jgi:hypothetical protein